eukprot:9411310-Karenia_brevis.AAC.1
MQYESFEVPQYGANMVAELDSDKSIDFEEKMMKMVSITVKQIMGELVPHLVKPQLENVRSVEGDKRSKLDE